MEMRDNVVTVLLIMIVTVAVILNSFTCLLFIAVKHKSLYLLLCLNLAVSDILQCIMGYSLETYLNNQENVSIAVCKGSAFLVGFFGLTSITILTVITILKIAIIKIPFTLHCIEGERKFIVGLVLFAWFYAFFWSVLPLIGWSSYTLDNTKRRCSVNFQPKDIAGKAYLSCLVIFCYTIPIICNIVCLCLSKRLIRKDSIYWSRTCGETNIVTLTYQSKSKKKFTLGCTMLALFLVAWTPYAVTGVVSQFEVIPVWLTDASALMAKSSPLINPILYCYRVKKSKQIKKTLLQKFESLF